MVENFRIPRPEVNQFIANAGYITAACGGVGGLIGMVLMTQPSEDGGIPGGAVAGFVFMGIGIAIYFLRIAIFQKNPDNARLLSQQELDDIHQRMHGKWNTTYPAGGLNCGTELSQPVDVANGQYTYTVYTKNRGQQQATRSLNIYRTPDNTYWLDNYGNQIYELDLPDLVKCNTYLGQDYTWQRTSEGAPQDVVAPNVSIHTRAPGDPTLPPSYDNSAGSGHSGGKSIAEELKKLDDLKSQGIITQEDFEAAKAKLLA